MADTPIPRSIPSVEGIEIYRSDVVVKRKGCKGHSVEVTRGEIREFSPRSRRRLAFVANNTDCEFRLMLTLTYPKAFPSDGREVKKHLNAFLTALRRRFPDLSYLWFLEFQIRGAPHVHIIMSKGTASRANQKWVSQAWYDICQSGDPNHLTAGTRTEWIRKRDGARRYAIKYAWKLRQKRVPSDYVNPGRFWGCSRDVTPTPRRWVTCTHDDLVGALETLEWRYLRGDIIRYRVLYNVASDLTDLIDSVKMTLSVIKADDEKHRRTERRKGDALPIVQIEGFRRPGDRSSLRDEVPS